MPKVDTTPASFKPYIFHGVDLGPTGSGGRAFADCPFCGREGKFSVVESSSVFRCPACVTGTDKTGGNPTIFVRKLWEKAECPEARLALLAEERGILNPNELKEWGVRIHPLLDEWCVPGWRSDGREVIQLYRYESIGGKRLLLATPTVGHALFGVQPLVRQSSGDVYMTEGPWDGAALREALSLAYDEGDGRLTLTGNPDASLLAQSDVIATPGCNVFQEKWATRFAGRRLFILFDSDHPKLRCQPCKKTWSRILYQSCPKCKGPLEGPEVPPTGWEGVQRIIRTLAKSEDRPSEVYYLHWGDEGYDPGLKSGYDVRDALTEGPARSSAPERVAALQALLAKVRPVPPEMVPGGTVEGNGHSSNGAAGSVGMECSPCHSWAELTKACRKALKWTEGLDRAFSCMLAVITSTRSVGSQLWMKIMGSAGCGKTTLCEALSVNRRFVKAKSTMRGFHSGYKAGGGGSDEDNSLIAEAAGKTLITKDGDTLLQAPNLPQILSEARDLYDSVSRSHYRNKAGRDYEGIRMTWLLCGTPSLRQIDSSELGERFLDCVIMESIDDDLEDEVLMRVAARARRALNYQADGKASTHYDPELVRMMQLAGGYVEWLRENAPTLIPEVNLSERAELLCAKLGKFVAFLRARPSNSKDERRAEAAGREFAARLVEQHIRLATCLAVVLNKKEVDGEVMRRVRQCSLDTARGRSLEIVRLLHNAGPTGMEARPLASKTNGTEEGCWPLLRFLRKIGAIRSFSVRIAGSTRTMYVLTDRMENLYKEVMSWTADNFMTNGEGE